MLRFLKGIVSLKHKDGEYTVPAITDVIEMPDPADGAITVVRRLGVITIIPPVAGWLSDSTELTITIGVDPVGKYKPISAAIAIMIREMFTGGELNFKNKYSAIVSRIANYELKPIN